VAQGQPPLTLDSGEPKMSAKQYMRNETRFRMVEKIDPERFKRLALMAERNTRQNVAVYKQMAGITVPQVSDAEAEAEPATAKK
jgi:pyruvate-ferredoxin/flavodoxin oxidoreductase